MGNNNVKFNFKLQFLIIVFGVSVLWMPAKAMAATYYISTSGVDTNPGTIDRPWVTINRATHNVVAGDTVYVRGGEYPTVQYGYQFLHSGTVSSPITLTNYPGEQVIFKITLTNSPGTPDGPDGYEAFQCWAYRGTPIADYIRVIGTSVSTKTLSNGLTSTKGIVIQGPTGVTNRESGFTITGCSHWEVAGIDFVELGYAIFTHHYTYDLTTGALLVKEVNSTDWYVHDNRVFNHFRESGMQFNDDHNRIENNEIYKVDDRYDTPYGCTQLNLLGHGNYVHGNIFSATGVARQCTGLLFEWDLSDDNVIDGNTFIDNPTGGIAFAGGDNNIIRNNIIYQKTVKSQFQAGISVFSDDNTIKKDWPCDETLGSMKYLLPPNDPNNHDYPHYFNPRDCHSRGNQIYNNTIYGYVEGVRLYPLIGENTTIRNNVFSGWTRGGICFYQASNGTCKPLTADVTSDHNIDKGNFGFANLAGYDFHLAAGSALIDAGLNLGLLVSNDFAGAVRPGLTAYDVGAYEYIPPITPSPPIINTYYVSTAGNDGNPGSQTQPWKTIAKVNGTVLQPDDTVLFKRGDTWNEKLMMNSSGTSGHNITFDAYGSGTKPIFDESVRKTDWVLYSGAIYRRSAGGEVGSEVRELFQDNVRLIKATSLAGMVAGSWFDGGQGPLYVWTTDSTNPNTGHVIEHPIWNNAIDFNAQGFITVRNIIGKRTKNGVFDFREKPGVHDITMQYTEAAQSGFRGYDGGGTIGVTTKYNITLDNVKAYDNVSEGIWMGIGHGITISNCEIYDGHKDASKGYVNVDGGGINIADSVTNVLVTGCYIHDVYESALMGIEWEAGAAQPSNVIIEHNRFLDNAVHVNVGGNVWVNAGSDSIFRNNIVEDTASSCGTHSGNSISASTGTGGSASGYKIYNNTIIQQCNRWGISSDDKSFYDARNNIIRNTVSNGVIQQGLFTIKSTFRNNLYYGISGSYFYAQRGTIPFNNFAAWAADSGETGSLVGAPLFVNESGGDYHLQSNSRAINVGATLAEVVSDYDGVGRPQGISYDIGAFEYVGGTLVPGDATGDGYVDGLDYVVWLNSYGTTTSQGARNGDYNNDGKVDGLDYVTWLNNYGK